VRYEWDPCKAQVNLAKHGVDLADAVSVLEDSLALTVADDETSEERFVTVGQDASGRVLVVVYTWRGEESIRIISARTATRRERRQYEGGP
jgi:uncharacterized DUF497 family protein